MIKMFLLFLYHAEKPATSGVPVKGEEFKASISTSEAVQRSHCFDNGYKWSDLTSAHLTFGLSLNLDQTSEILHFCIVCSQTVDTQKIRSTQTHL